MSVSGKAVGLKPPKLRSGARTGVTPIQRRATSPVPQWQPPGCGLPTRNGTPVGLICMAMNFA
jgi:hypothetical protein